MAEDKINEFDEILTLQSMLLEIEEDSFKSIFEYICDNDFLNSKLSIRLLMNALKSAFFSRPLKHDFYIRIFEKCKDLIKEKLTDDEIKAILKSSQPRFFVQMNFFFYSLIEIGLAQLSWISSLFYYQTSYLYFLPEIQKNNIKPVDYLPPKLQKIVDNMDIEKHITDRKTGYSPDKIAQIIRNDDIDAFQELEFYTEFSFDIQLPDTIYERFLFADKEKSVLAIPIPLISYAAYYGASNIFKYAWIKLPYDNQSLFYCAIAGGNPDIIHLIENLHNSDEEKRICMSIAIEFHRNEILKYLFENGVEYTIDSLIDSISFSNYEAFLEILPYVRKDINKNGSKKMNALHMGSYLGDLKIVQFLCSLPNIDVNAKDVVYKATPMHYACQENHIDIVKFLSSCEKIEINSEDKFVFFMIL